jgi:hypothetical protein
MQLLPGWDSALDKKSGMTYYFNVESNERTWDWRKVIAAPPAQHSMYTSRRKGAVKSPKKTVPKRPQVSKDNYSSPRASRARVK